jgi:hypothetical protein
MSKRIGTCDFCGADQVPLQPVNTPGKQETGMCDVCYDIGMSSYVRDSFEPVTRRFLSLAVRHIINAVGSKKARMK